MTEITIPIPARLRNAAQGGHVAGSEDIDAGGNKNQKQVNDDVNLGIQILNDKIGPMSGNKNINERLDDLEAAESITYEGGEAQIAQGSDFTNPDATKRAKIPTVGAIVDGLNDGIYDVSKRNPTGGPNSDGKFTLDYILDNANTLIPTGWRHGGMTISFVQSSDNKYVQFRYMGTTTTGNPNPFLNTDNWQKQGAEVNVDKDMLMVGNDKKGLLLPNIIFEDYDATAQQRLWELYLPNIPSNKKAYLKYLGKWTNSLHTYSEIHVSVYTYTQTDKSDEELYARYIITNDGSTLSAYGIVDMKDLGNNKVGYAFVDIPNDINDDVQVELNIDNVKKLETSPKIASLVLSSRISPLEKVWDLTKYVNVTVTQTLYQSNKYIAPDGTFTDNNNFDIWKLTIPSAYQKSVLYLRSISTLGEGLVVVAAYDSSNNLVNTLVVANKNIALGIYNFIADLRFSDNVSYLLISTSKSQSNVNPIKVYAEQYEDFWNHKQEDGIVYHDITLTTDGSTPKLGAVLNSINDSSYYNRYRIYLTDGTYDIMDGISHVKDNDTNKYGDGVWVKDYVSIIGKNSKEKTIVKCELDPSVDTQSAIESGIEISIMERISTINATSNSHFENLTITAKNCRYCFHCDTSNYKMIDTEIVVKNVDFIHYGDTSWAGCAVTKRMVSSPSCYGGGLRNGQRRIFDNCSFVAHNAPSWFTHDNPQQTRPAYISLVNCRFFSSFSDSYSQVISGISFISYGINVKSIVDMRGCSCNAPMRMVESASDATQSYGCDYDVTGYGNNLCIGYIEKTNTATPRNTYCVRFSDETLMVKNTTANDIALGKAVRTAYTCGIQPITAGGERRLFGFAYKDIAGNDIGIIKVRGYLSLEDVGLSGLGVGAKLRLDGDTLVQDDVNGTIIVNLYGFFKIPL